MPQNPRCAHAPCTCPAAEGSKFCSPACERAGGGEGESCTCGHPGCEGQMQHR